MHRAEAALSCVLKLAVLISCSDEQGQRCKGMLTPHWSCNGSWERVLEIRLPCFHLKSHTECWLCLKWAVFKAVSGRWSFSSALPPSRQRIPPPSYVDNSTQQQCHEKVTIELNCQLLTSVIACPGKCNHSGPSSQDHLMVCSAAWLYAEQPAAGTQAVFTSATPAISALTHVPEPGLKYLLGHLQNRWSGWVNEYSFSWAFCFYCKWLLLPKLAFGSWGETGFVSPEALSGQCLQRNRAQ